MKNKNKVKAVNFTTFCKNATLEQIKTALEFYNEKFEPEKVLKYFSNWKMVNDNSTYRNGKILTNKHSNGKWETTITINDNAEYVFGDNDSTWQYIPKTMSEFISDVLRYEDFDLILSDEGVKRIYGK